MAFLEMTGITKRFGELVANDSIDFSVEKGEIHALLGENGAGKSTLMNILYGLYTQNEGSILLDGQPASISEPNDAIRLGIGMVHQHFMLIPSLTVIENVVLGHEAHKGRLNLEAAAKRFQSLAAQYGMQIDPFEKVSRLSVGQQQRLEILKALYRNARLLILDEPTAVLTPQEVSSLFKTLKKLTDDGYTIIFITHKLAEVMDICDRCTVLRQGKKVCTLGLDEIEDKQVLATLMVGREIDLMTHKSKAAPKDPVLEVCALTYRDGQNVTRLDNITLAIAAGEILGICGVDGNGQSELVQCITGLLPPSSGRFSIDGTDCVGKKPRDILNMQVSHIPEDRKSMGMIAEMTVNENLILMSYANHPYIQKGFLNWKWIVQHNEALCQKYDVKTPSIFEQIGKLSGGNQQKCVVGRELDRSPRLLIAVHPDRGLDIGATKYIQSRIVEERDRGAAVLLVSTELDEIMELSDRILVLYEGRAMATLPQEEATRDRLGLLMAGVAAC